MKKALLCLMLLSGCAQQSAPAPMSTILPDNTSACMHVGGTSGHIVIYKDCGFHEVRKAPDIEL